MRRLPFLAGESYWMPPNAIHDVEIDTKVAATRPCVTLMLHSESDRAADVRRPPAIVRAGGGRRVCTEPSLLIHTI